MNTRRPISVSHLVFGLIFLGATALWTIGAATDADAPDMALLAPAILIGAGVAGLIALVVNARNARISATAGNPIVNPSVNPTPEDPEYADTGVIDQEELQ